METVMGTVWTEKQEEELEALRELAGLEMTQAYELCREDDKFVVAKTYNYVFKRGMNRDVPREIRAIRESEHTDKEVWTLEFTEEAVIIAQAGIQRKMDYVRMDFFRRFGDDVERYGFKGCTGTAGVILLAGIFLLI
jgi:hypothetical protein